MPRAISKWTGALLAVVFFAAAVLAACRAGDSGAGSSARPAATTPAAPAQTALGSLGRVARVKQVTLQTRCIKSPSDRMVGVVGSATPKDALSTTMRGETEVYSGKPGTEVFVILNRVGVCSQEEPAAHGREFVVLSFEGKAERSLNQDGELAQFVPAGAGGLLARADSHSYLSDASAAKARGLVIAAEENRRQLAFEVAAGAKQLVWHDRSAAYQLEPHPKAMAAPSGK